ncbi:hypothetical protein B0H14DRAFT_2900838 [Mycena olivaceomarginata]|nr:hypothetical protein B0H14DRAFT_2900838 [Mycena olivaceomarginata]
MMQNTKFQKERCLRIVEDTHHFLCVLMNLSVHSEDIQSPKMLTTIAQYALTLQKIDSCLRMQQELGTIKRLFKQSELVTQLDTCETELKTALEEFTIRQGVGHASALVEFKVDTEERHQQLLELISTQSDSVDTVSSKVSGSFSLLPASPQIFHGRESELQDIVNTLLAEPARVAILGPGGMGKTSLAVAALHSAQVVDKYPTRHFIPCESAQTNDVLVATIASHLGLHITRGTARHILHHLTSQPPCLLMLDNFETPWEPVDGRPKVEELLALLADIPPCWPSCTPSKVQWTRPFLPPLRPLSTAAAHQTFIEIADEIHDVSEVDQLLEITDNIPLAVQLVANVAASEGCQPTLERWKLEHTALLSAGYDKQSNLEISIKLSLSSSRLASLPDAVDLLSLMSLLPDGISDTDLVQSRLPIPQILKCKATLVRTSLAYVDHAGRSKVLAPIRDYIQRTRPPSPHLVRPLRKHLNDLLQLWKKFMHSSSGVGGLTQHLVSNLGNIHNLLVDGLDYDHTDIGATIQAILSLNELNLAMSRGLTPLMQRLQEMLPQINDNRVHGQFIVETFRASWFHDIPNPDKYMDEAIEHLRLVNDIESEARLYVLAAQYYAEKLRDHKKAQNLYHRALASASQCNSHMLQVRGLNGLALIECIRGTWSEGLQFSHQAHRISVAAGDIGGELTSFQCQARCYLAFGDFKHGLDITKEWKALILRAGIQGGVPEFTLMNMEAEIHQLRTDYASAKKIQDVILSHTSPVLSPFYYALALVNIVALDLATGGCTDIISGNLQVAIDTFRRIQFPSGNLVCEVYTADLNLRKGDIRGARDQYICTFNKVYASDIQIAGYCLVRLADSNRPVHATSEIAVWAVIFLAFTMYRSRGGMLLVHQALRCLGDVIAQQGMNYEALSILTVALEGFTWMDVHQSRAECMQTIGDVHFQHGHIAKAFTFWTEARPLFEQSSQAKRVSEINLRLAKLAQQHEASLEQLSKLSVFPLSSQQPSIDEAPGDKDEDIRVNGGHEV